MSRRVPVTIATLVALVSANAAATTQAPKPVQVMASASLSAGRVHGLVKDPAGRAVVDASVLAVGSVIVAARSDVGGRFSMSLPAGQYVLRATRAGYVSTYREAIRVGASDLVERTITLTAAQDEARIDAADHPHTETAWRLRHLTRSVLRDESGWAGAASGTAPPAPVSFLDRAVDSSLRLASSLFADPDFSGQVNLLTTTAMRDPWRSTSTIVPRGVAYVVVGAPAGSAGDWRVRAAVASGDGSAWNLLGEYTARAGSAHALHAGLSYSAQGYAPDTYRRKAASLDTRTVAGVFASDRWQARPWLHLDYGARVDHYDYLAARGLVSAHGEAGVRLWPRLVLQGRVERHRLAPGADAFMPPPAAGVWLPAERTFSLLSERAGWQAQDVRHGELSVRQQFGAGDAAVHARVFRQQTTDQMATLFGIRDAGLGHYYVAYVGAVDVEGWAVGFDGPLGGPVTGRVEYAGVQADWTGRSGRLVRRAAPSVVRPGHERIHDVTASIEADVARTSTFVRVAFRASSAFSVGAAGRAPRPDGRWDIEIRQGLSPQDDRGHGIELLFTVRTLARDLRQGVSFYDELLTIQPPTRLMGGIRMRF